MSQRNILNLGIIGIFAIAVLFVMQKWHSESWQSNPIIPLIAVIVLAVVGGTFFALVILPKFGDAVGTVMYSSGEEITQDESMRAAAKMAAGDYHGAIEEFEKMLKNKPDDVFPISEIAKIHADKLHEPDKAINFLQEHIEGQEWTEDNAAFLMFRLADILAHKQDFVAAHDMLEQVVGTFPGTRHSANAKHRINELEELEFKQIQATRAAEGAREIALEEEPD
ncbi:MAG: hypothetical protein WCN98_09375 [Verrucomicrobiaceae bacterium]